MKKLLLILMMFIGTLGYSQCEYSTELNENSKDSLSNITMDLITYDRKIDSALHFYSTVDFDFDFMDSICRLYDGTTETFNIISIDNRNNKYLVKMINIMGQEVDDNYTGIVIYQYSDGTFEKKIHK